MPPYLYIPRHSGYGRIEVSDIILLEGGKIYANIITSKESFLIRNSLTELHRKLGYSHFCRVHASYVVNLAHVVYFTEELINLGDREVPVGRRYRAAFYNQIIILR